MTSLIYAGLIIFILLLVAFILPIYVYMAIVLHKIAKKTNTEEAGWAWIPILNVVLMLRIAKKPLWVIIGFFIPFVNYFFIGVLWGEIAKALNKSKWWGALWLVPILGNFFVPAHLAFSKTSAIKTLAVTLVPLLWILGAAALVIPWEPPHKQNLSIDIIDVTIDGKTWNGSTVKVTAAGEYDLKVRVKIYDKNNNPVQKASVTLSGGGGFGANQTDTTGESVIKLGADSEGTSVNIRFNQQTVELKLVVKANGFYDYEDEKAVLLYQARQ